MALSVSTSGPNITSQSNIKFSDLRKYFLKMNPRTTFSGSETFDTLDGPVSASQLLKQTTFSTDTTPNGGNINEEVDINYKSPFVPSCVENNAISSSTNWKTSQFVGSIKYYFVQQSSTNEHLSLNNTTLGTSNFDKTIRKWVFVDGVIGSTANGLAALQFNSTTHHLSVKVSGQILGKAGSAGVYGVNNGNGEGAGGNGGDAVFWNNFGTVNNYIIFLQNSKIYAGGGGGGRGGNGGRGGAGGIGGTRRIRCLVGPNFDCVQDTGGGGAGGPTRGGASGGSGAGYGVAAATGGSPGGFRNGGSGPNHHNSGSGGPSGYNTAGGPGGTFGANGTSRTSSVGTGGNRGGNGFIAGTCTTCGGGPGPQRFFCCHGGQRPSGYNGSGGTAGKVGGAAGRSIRRVTSGVPYTLIDNDSDNLKGLEGT